MNLPIWLTSPLPMFLLRWTCLLALGWGVHGLLRHRHARWRLILWRGILCFGLALPLLHFLQVPGIKIPVTREATGMTEVAGSLRPETVVNPIQPALLQPQMLPAPAAPSSPAPCVPSLPVSAPPKQIPWGTVLLLTWALGCVSGAIRLLRLHRQLSRLRRGTSQPSPDLQRLARNIQAQLKVQREPELRISEAVTSPFVCGLLRPAIVLPRMLLEQLSPGELAALLTHEMAHLRHHDLLWSVAWRWLGAVCWFHPLVWRIPAAHNLACDQEADRVASGQMAEQDSYSQSLARLALRVLALPAVETELTLNGSSQIARRLVHLGKEQTNAWNWRHSVAGLALVGSLFLMTAAWGFSKTELLSAGGAPQSPETVAAAGDMAAGAGAAADVGGTGTAARGAPPAIEKVVSLPAITLKTKGKMPEEAFRMLGEATGVKIVAAPRVVVEKPDPSRGPNSYLGGQRSIDLWSFQKYEPVELDLEGESFWGAMGKLTEAAHVSAGGSGQWVELRPANSPGMAGYTEYTGWSSEMMLAPGTAVYAKDAGLYRARVVMDQDPFIQFDVDPRIRLAGWSVPVLLEARDGTGKALASMALTEGSGLIRGTVGVGNPTWQLGFHGVGLDASGTAVPLQEVVMWRGYLPVEVATKCVPIKLACEVGSHADAGGWTFRVTETKRVALTGGRGGGATPGFRIQVEAKAEGEPSLPVPKNLARFVRAEPLPPEGSPETCSVAGGYGETARDRLITLEFSAKYFPERITIDVPVEVKAAALGFEFKDMKGK